ncbi:hypothetical protein GRN08_1530 [Salmonella phage GRNsp8]|uniref:Uncharacterized protein n=1 Tax=Salmonella phage GRNsp8 TaxID=2948589 RepID=A0A9E7LA85_9CAUD|nr:hypothetical protein GRN08_1530 [Salmonella phage GRNsp8]
MDKKLTSYIKEGKFKIERFSENGWTLNKYWKEDEIDIDWPQYIVFTEDLVMEDVVSQIVEMPEYAWPTLAGIASVLRNRGADVYNAETSRGKQPSTLKKPSQQKKTSPSNPSGEQASDI